ncbi:MAG: carbohydrate-binding protein, partial [Bacteroidales bacterium]|nr:carbohydrate-binding protein [Bacteroidales bacterium]
INNGDWTEYEINVPQSGTYKVDFRVATATAGGNITIQSNGSNVGTVNVGNTGGWQNWITKSTNVSLNKGEQTLRLAYNSGSGFLFNVNWIEFTYDNVPAVTYYYITNKSQQKNIRPASNGVNAQVVQAAGNNGGDDQQWSQQSTSGGYFYLKNKQSNYYLSMENAADGSSTVQIAQGLLSSKAEWTTNLSPDGTTVYLVNRASGKHIRPNTGDVGSPIVAQPNTWVGDWTRWNLVDVSTKSVEAQNNSLTQLYVQVYPNPVSGMLNVDISGVDQANTIEIYNIHGAVVYENRTTNNHLQINTENWNKGIYFIKIKHDTHSAMQKLIVK